MYCFLNIYHEGIVNLNLNKKKIVIASLSLISCGKNTSSLPNIFLCPDTMTTWIEDAIFLTMKSMQQAWLLIYVYFQKEKCRQFWKCSLYFRQVTIIAFKMVWFDESRMIIRPFSKTVCSLWAILLQSWVTETILSGPGHEDFDDMRPWGSVILREAS